MPWQYMLPYWINQNVGASLQAVPRFFHKNANPKERCFSIESADGTKPGLAKTFFSFYVHHQAQLLLPEFL